MLFQLCIVMFMGVIVLKLLMPEVMNTNMTFYLAFLTCMLYVGNLGKNTFLHGYCTLTDETKVLFMLCFKSFIIVFLGLMYTEGGAALWLLNIDIPEAHEAMLEKMNRIYALMGTRMAL